MYVAARQPTTRSYLTAGVALVGASVIVVSPMAPMPDIHLPSIRSAEAQLAALANPFDAYAQVFQDTIANLQPIIATAAARMPIGNRLRMDRLCGSADVVGS